MNFTLGTDWPPDSVARLGWPWTKVCSLGETGSTNADLAEAARAGAASGLALVAGHQTGGRGRLGRVWEAPPGTSLAISVLLRPPTDVPTVRWLWLPLLAGLAVADALVEVAEVPAEVKWPNDVLVNGAKICGILAERVAAGGDPAVVIGMGINTSLSAEQLPVPTATSLALAGVDVPDEEVIAAVLGSLGRWYSRWLAGEEFAGTASRRCATIGRQVRVEVSGGESVTGEAVGMDAAGRLLVRSAEGTQAFAAGDVIHLR